MDECGRLAAELEGERGQVFRRRARDLASNPRRAGEKQVIERQPRKCLADLRTAGDDGELVGGETGADDALQKI